MTLFTDWTLTDPHYFFIRGAIWGIVAAIVFLRIIVPRAQSIVAKIVNTTPTTECDLLVAGLVSLHYITDHVQVHSIFETGKVEHHRIDCLIDKVRKLEQDKVTKLCREGKWRGSFPAACWFESGKTLDDYYDQPIA